ncbi:hypothetical protein P7K49_039263 [Saguinus oedipus]|uniref:Uncharacterized protein n=1 Tax=Saguinus oedipus TaxID=9490 RepID=A0ABQ9TH03_SAGOE|nr:hypothetical protein P7K49_039263 [Saguinus oedipus]
MALSARTKGARDGGIGRSAMSMEKGSPTSSSNPCPRAPPEKSLPNWRQILGLPLLLSPTGLWMSSPPPA